MMITSLVAALLCTPPQGVTVQLPAPTVEAAPPATADAVLAAAKDELTAQGYGVVGPQAKGQAEVSSKVACLGIGCLVTLTLKRQSDGLILDEQKEHAASQAELPRATRAAARRIASQMRMTWGVRVKVKSK